MTAPREIIFQALFALAQGITWDAIPENGHVGTFKTTTRRIVLFDKVNSAAQPWLGQAEHAENSNQVTGMPYKRIWDAQWMIYHRAGDLGPKGVPAILTNQILDAVETALKPKPADPGFLDKRNTLSGLVHHCFIQGTIFKDPGDIDNQALIVVPIKLLVP